MRKKKNDPGPDEEIHELILADASAEESTQSGVLGVGRMLVLTGDLDEGTAASLVGSLIELDRMDYEEPIDLIISTYGGSVDEMFAIYDVMRLIRCPIRTVGVGKIMSAGVLLLAAGTKGMRFLGYHARLMIHPMSTFVTGNVFQHNNEMDELTRVQEQIEECLAAETRLSRKKLIAMMKKGSDQYISSKEAIEHGIVDFLF